MIEPQSTYAICKHGLQKAYDKAGDYLDRHPTLYKVVLVACHAFRALSMYGIMMWMPLPPALNVSLLTGGTLLYRAAVERFCCFRFAIPSMVGGGAAWMAHAATVNFVSGTALASLSAAFLNSLAFLPLLGYTAWIIYLSHEDIEKRMEKLQSEQSSPCHSACHA